MSDGGNLPPSAFRLDELEDFLEDGNQVEQQHSSAEEREPGGILGGAPGFHYRVVVDLARRDLLDQPVRVIARVDLFHPRQASAVSPDGRRHVAFPPCGTPTL